MVKNELYLFIMYLATLFGLGAMICMGYNSAFTTTLTAVAMGGLGLTVYKTVKMKGGKDDGENTDT